MTTHLDPDTVPDLVAIAASTMWNIIARDSPQYIAPWDDQSETSQRLFIRAFVIGLEHMAYAQGDA